MKLEETKKDLELYFHIPFCVKKCNYCDFLSAPCTRETQESYMAALFAELEGRAKEYSDYRVISVFIGGGTPSIVEANRIAELLERARRLFAFSEDVEITIEVNPGTVDEKKLRTYFEAGINRLSIGLQSADDTELKMLGRIHTYEQFLETYALAGKVGFVNINVDVMSALPGQTMESYRETLQRLLELSPMPEHISAYSLIVEEGTVFAKWEEEGRLDLPDEDTEREMYEETKRILGEAGFQRYEISNYAREGYECRHNCGYWKRVDYLGFGIGAASLVNNTRFQNDVDLLEYLQNPLLSRCEETKLTLQERMEETMFLGLRMTKGVSVQEFERQFGQPLESVYGAVIRKNIGEGLLIFATRENNGEKYHKEYMEDDRKEDRYLRLTNKGLDVSNHVMSQFLFD